MDPPTTAPACAAAERRHLIDHDEVCDCVTVDASSTSGLASLFAVRAVRVVFACGGCVRSVAGAPAEQGPCLVA